MRLSSFIVSQKPCGNLLLRGTGPRRGNLTPLRENRSCRPCVCAWFFVILGACGYFSRLDEMKIGDCRKKKEPGSPLRGRGTPAYPARLRSERARTWENLLFVFLGAQKFVALDGGDDANGALVARFGALNTSEATNANGSCKGDFVRQGEEDFDRRSLLHILGQEEVDPAGADVAGFGAGFSNRGTRRPADGKRKAHLKALRGAAFGPVQSGAS